MENCPEDANVQLKAIIRDREPRRGKVAGPSAKRDNGDEL